MGANKAPNMKLFKLAKQTVDYLLGWFVFVGFSMLYLLIYPRISGNLHSHLTLAIVIYGTIALFAYLFSPTIRHKTQHPLTYLIIPFSFILSFATYFFWGDWYAFQMVKCMAHLSVFLALGIYADVLWHNKL
mgnify:FL=1|jgi:predicted MFS family arabinose efflux permease